MDDIKHEDTKAAKTHEELRRARRELEIREAVDASPGFRVAGVCRVGEVVFVCMHHPFEPTPKLLGDNTLRPISEQGNCAGPGVLAAFPDGGPVGILVCG